MESTNPNRREFLTRTAMAAAGASALTGLSQAEGKESSATSGPRLKKALKFQMIGDKISILDKFKMLKELGYDGVEFPAPRDYDKDEVIAAIKETNLPVHGVVHANGWKETHLLSSPDLNARKKGIASLQQAARDAKAYGASSVLVVPGKATKEISYDQAYRRSQECIREVIPLARELGLRLLIENVWNDYLLSPLEAARYLDEFESPVMGWYFDVGNVVRFGWPEQWIRILNKRIVKLDIKEYSRELQKTKGPWNGFGVEITDGDCDWPAVMTALKEIGYNGWATAEVPGGDRARIADISKRMDKAFASLPSNG